MTEQVNSLPAPEGSSPTSPAAASPRVPILLREGEPSDLPFIYATWINHVRETKPWSGCDLNWVSAAQHALVERLLRRSVVQVACSPAYPDQIYGYLVGQPRERIVHWCYVKGDRLSGGRFLYRRQGIATRLLEDMFEGLGTREAPIEASFRSPALSQQIDEEGNTLQTLWNLKVRTHHLCERR